MPFDDRGRYITLLSLMHQQGRMDEETIRLLVGSFSVKLKSKFKQDENGLFFNERLEFETEKRNKFTESRRNNGSLGGRPENNKKPKGKPKNNLMVNHKDNLMEDENKNEIDNKNKTELELKFDEFLKFRIVLKKPVKEESLEALKKQLWKLSNQNEQTAIEIIDQSIANGYQGLFELKNNKQNGKFISKADERARGFKALDAELNSVLAGVKL